MNKSDLQLFVVQNVFLCLTRMLYANQYILNIDYTYVWCAMAGIQVKIMNGKHVETDAWSCLYISCLTLQKLTAIILDSANR